MRLWFSARQRNPTEKRRFAALRAMPPAEREAALRGADGAGWIEAAALYGLVEAQVLWGQSLLNTDPALAFTWFSGAAATGHAPALNMLGRCFEKGWGTGADAVRAVEHYRAAAAKGLDWAQFNLAGMLLQGLGTGRDRIEAFAWYERAAAQGHAKAINMLGRFHEEGWDRARDPALAAFLYRQAALGGDYRGQFNLATILAATGRSGEATAWFSAALSTGNADFVAEARLLLGHSTEPDHRALAQWDAPGDRPRRGINGSRAMIA